MRVLLMIAVFSVGAAAVAAAAPAETTGANAPSSFQVDRACAGCHKAIYERYYGTVAGSHASTMARALYPIAEAAPLRTGKQPLEFKLGKYSYTVSGSNYAVTDGTNTLKVVLEYAFGRGAAGQTYAFQYEGNWYESRLSFYDRLQALDLTMGAPPGEPRTLLEAAGREMTGREVNACFGCHTTNAIVSGKIDFKKMEVGIGCQNCHENAVKHARNMQAQTPPVLGKMTTEEQSDFCGRCHRTWADIAAGGPQGVGNVRFQPYRLANSKCYNATDRRISCTACHDPHGPINRNAKAYDSRCTNCHNGAAVSDGGRPLCKAGNKDNCSTCHMPKFEIPGSHHLFSDHQIRIVRAGDKYPN